MRVYERAGEYVRVYERVGEYVSDYGRARRVSSQTNARVWTLINYHPRLAWT